MLGRHRAERHDQRSHHVVAEVREPLVLLHALVVAERASALADREPGREDILLEIYVACGSVAGLVDRDSSRLLLDVLDVLRRPRLDCRHRLDDVAPSKPPAALGMRNRQRHRAALLDHRRRVAVRDPRQLGAASAGVEVGLVVDLVEVEVEDVEPIILGRRAEPDVAAHAAGTDQRRI